MDLTIRISEYVSYTIIVALVLVSVLRVWGNKRGGPEI